MNETQKANVRRVLIGAASVLLIFYIAYQAYMIIHNPVGTEIAHEFTMSDTIDAEVFVARNEDYIINGEKGTVIAAVADGSRVSKNQDIAHVFSDSDAADTYKELLRTDEQIERYTRLSGQSDNYLFDVSDLDSYIDDETIKLVTTVSDRRLTELDTRVNELRNRIVTKQISTGSRLDFESKLDELTARRAELEKKSTQHKNITAPESGYFISGADGFEKTVNCAEISSITPETVKAAFEAKPEEVPKGAMGRIVKDFKWYFLFVAESRLAAGLTEGKEVTVKLPYSSADSVKATVLKLNESTATGEVAVVLESNLMDPGIAALRRETAEIIISDHKGLKIPSSAIVMNEDGEKGVYVLNGNIAKFKKINVIYATDSYILSKAEEGKDGYVRLYDNVITEGKDLYDGKVVR